MPVHHPALTIVVPTIPGRDSLLSRCLHSITNQHGDAAVLVIEGDGLLGDKVAAAASAVSTDYMTIVDDDDLLDGGYLAAVSPHLGDVDYVGFKFAELNAGRLENVSASSAEFERWGRRSRGPVPKGISRTSIFRAVKFGNDYKADRRWTAAARALVTRWAFVDRVLYVHDWTPSGSAFGEKREHRDVGNWPHDPVDRMTVAA